MMAGDQKLRIRQRKVVVFLFSSLRFIQALAYSFAKLHQRRRAFGTEILHKALQRGSITQRISRNYVLRECLIFHLSITGEVMQRRSAQPIRLVGIEAVLENDVICSLSSQPLLLSARFQQIGDNLGVTFLTRPSQWHGPRGAGLIHIGSTLDQ